jgi:FtsP/CotA-like multicopper oxidase with cupredoxin domain
MLFFVFGETSCPFQRLCSIRSLAHEKSMCFHCNPSSSPKRNAGKAQWIAPPKFRWDYTNFAKPGATAPEPDETFEMTFAKENAVDNGFNRWTINGVAYPTTGAMASPAFHLHGGRRYRVRMRNESDDLHPIHLHRHTFELTNIMGKATAGVMKDVVMLGGYQEVAFDFVAHDPSMTLFHFHQQLHMDFGFMTLFDYV